MSALSQADPTDDSQNPGNQKKGLVQNQEVPAYGTLSNEAFDILNYCIFKYHINGDLPKFSELQEDKPNYELPEGSQFKSLEDLWVSCWKNKTFLAAIREQEIPLANNDEAVDPYNPNPLSSRLFELSARQIRTAIVLLDISDTRSDKKKLQDLKVSTSEYNLWLKNPKFKQFMHERSSQLLEENSHEADLALLENVKRGDLKSIEYFNEYQGRFVRQSKTGSNGSLDAHALIMKIIEIIQINVTDTETQMRISEGIRNLIAAQNTAQQLLNPGQINAPNPVTPPVTQPALPSNPSNDSAEVLKGFL